MAPATARTPGRATTEKTPEAAPVVAALETGAASGLDPLVMVVGVVASAEEEEEGRRGEQGGKRRRQRTKAERSRKLTDELSTADSSDELGDGRDDRGVGGRLESGGVSESDELGVET